MGTIGELEKRAGIGPSRNERMAFWLQFRDLDGIACLNAGVAELNKRVIECKVYPVATSSEHAFRLPGKQKRLPLTNEQQRALQAYAVKHGRRWKIILNHVWMGSPPYDDGGTLRGLRNSHGPSWLVSYRLPKPAAEDHSQPSRSQPPPETG